MDTLVRLLKNTELFAGISQEILLQEILPKRQIQEYQKGQFLIVPQQKIDRFGIILSGKVHILHILPEGNYSLMSALTAGDIMGADLVCSRTQLSPYHAQAAAVTRVLYLPVTLLSEPGDIHRSERLVMMDNLLKLISDENMKKEYRLAILSQKGLRERIMTYLTMQANRKGTTSLAISFSREELASFLCVNRSALSHELSLMQQDGLITFRKNMFTIHWMPIPK